MSELVLAVFVVLAAGFAHASTPLDAKASAALAQQLESRWEAGDKTVQRDPSIDTLHLADDSSECFVRPAHGSATDSVAECYSN